MTPELADCYWRAGFRHITEEVYRLKKAGKLNSTKEKALAKDLLDKLDAGEYSPPLSYVIEEMEKL